MSLRPLAPEASASASSATSASGSSRSPPETSPVYGKPQRSTTTAQVAGRIRGRIAVTSRRTDDLFRLLPDLPWARVPPLAAQSEQMRVVSTGVPKTMPRRLSHSVERERLAKAWQRRSNLAAARTRMVERRIDLISHRSDDSKDLFRVFADLPWPRMPTLGSQFGQVRYLRFF